MDTKSSEFRAFVDLFMSFQRNNFLIYMTIDDIEDFILKMS